MSDRWTPFGVAWQTPDGLIRYATTRTVAPLASLADLHDISVRYWFSNFSCTGTLPVGKLSPRVMILPDGWFGDSLASILIACGLSARPDGSDLQSLKMLLTQTVRLTVQTLAPLIGTREGVVFQTILHSPTLAEGLAKMLRSLSPQPLPLRDVLFDAVCELSLPSPVPDRSLPSPAMVVASFPVLDYAMALARTPVPAPGRWHMLQSYPDHVIKTPAQIAPMKQWSRPVILCGKFQPKWRWGNPIVCYLTHGRSPVFGRQFFIPEDIEVLVRYGRFHADGTLLGPPYQSPGTLPALNLFMGGLGNHYGDQARAARCVAANLVAHNVLATVLGRPGTDAFLKGLDSAWLVARDRLNLLPALNAIVAADGIMDTIGAGAVTCTLPEDASRLAALITRLNQLGLDIGGAWSGLCRCRTPRTMPCRHPVDLPDAPQTPGTG